MKDIDFKTKEGTFIHRASGILICNNKILIAKKKNTLSYTLLGGKVHIGENSENAILREVEEELGTSTKIKSLAYIVENFFKEENSLVHKLAMYYILELKDDYILSRGDTFTEIDVDGSVTEFKWLPIEELREIEFYPVFLKDSILDIPDHTKHIIEDKLGWYNLIFKSE